MDEDSAPDVLTGETCPICRNPTLTLTEDERDVPYFGKCYIFSMDCDSCRYHKADVEITEEGDPVKYTLDIAGEEDLKVRVIKSSEATVRLPHIGAIEPGEGSNGYITNVEGILGRMKVQIEHLRDSEEDPETQKKAKNLLKKVLRVMMGQEPQRLVIEDPTGNSAIVSEKAVKGKP